MIAMALALEPKRCCRRRADHSARRHHAGADPQADPQSAAQPQHGRDVHHPRHRRRRRYRRPRRGDASWQDRGNRARSTPSSANPQHDYTKAAVSLPCRRCTRRCARRWMKCKACRSHRPRQDLCDLGRLVQAGSPRAGGQRSHVLHHAGRDARPRRRVRFGQIVSGASGDAADRGRPRHRLASDAISISGLEGKALRAQRHRIQMIFQDPFASLNPRRRVGQIITDGPIARGTDPKVAMAACA
jgi:hypothetical protein